MDQDSKNYDHSADNARSARSSRVKRGRTDLSSFHTTDTAFEDGEVIFKNRLYFSQLLFVVCYSFCFLQSLLQLISSLIAFYLPLPFLGTRGEAQ